MSVIRAVETIVWGLLAFLTSSDGTRVSYELDAKHRGAKHRHAGCPAKWLNLGVMLACSAHLGGLSYVCRWTEQAHGVCGMAVDAARRMRRDSERFMFMSVLRDTMLRSPNHDSSSVRVESQE